MAEGPDVRWSSGKPSLWKWSAGSRAVTAKFAVQDNRNSDHEYLHRETPVSSGWVLKLAGQHQMFYLPNVFPQNSPIQVAIVYHIYQMGTLRLRVQRELRAASLLNCWKQDLSPTLFEL